MSSVSAAYMLAADNKRSANSSANQTPKSSIDSTREQGQAQAHAQSGSSFKRVARRVMKAAKEHHDSVNLAFESYYGPMSYKTQNTKV